MTHSAQTALRTAQLKPFIGRFAARRMVERSGVPVYLYRIACQQWCKEQNNKYAFLGWKFKPVRVQAIVTKVIK